MSTTAAAMSPWTRCGYCTTSWTSTCLTSSSWTPSLPSGSAVPSTTPLLSKEALREMHRQVATSRSTSRASPPGGFWCASGHARRSGEHSRGDAFSGRRALCQHLRQCHGPVSSLFSGLENVRQSIAPSSQEEFVQATQLARRAGSCAPGWFCCLRQKTLGALGILNNFE